MECIPLKIGGKEVFRFLHVDNSDVDRFEGWYANRPRDQDVWVEFSIQKGEILKESVVSFKSLLDDQIFSFVVSGAVASEHFTVLERGLAKLIKRRGIENVIWVSQLGYSRNLCRMMNLKRDAEDPIDGFVALTFPQSTLSKISWNPFRLGKQWDSVLFSCVLRLDGSVESVIRVLYRSLEHSGIAFIGHVVPHPSFIVACRMGVCAVVIVHKAVVLSNGRILLSSSGFDGDERLVVTLPGGHRFLGETASMAAERWCDLQMGISPRLVRSLGNFTDFVVFEDRIQQNKRSGSSRRI